MTKDTDIALEVSHKVIKGSRTSPVIIGMLTMIWYLTQIGLQRINVIMGSVDVSILKATAHLRLLVLFIKE